MRSSRFDLQRSKRYELSTLLHAPRKDLVAAKSERHKCGGFSLPRHTLQSSYSHACLSLKINTPCFTTQYSSVSTVSKETHPRSCFWPHCLHVNIYSLPGSWHWAGFCKLLSLSLSPSCPINPLLGVSPWQWRAGEGKETDSHPHSAGWICGLIKRFHAQGHFVKENCLSETRGHKLLHPEAPDRPASQAGAGCSQSLLCSLGERHTQGHRSSLAELSY